MGKTKSKRHKKVKSNPTGLPSVRDIEKEEEDLGASGDCVMLSKHSGDLANVTQSITEKLQGVNVEDKECGCCNVASLVEDKASIGALLEQGIVRHLGPLLVDPSFVVRHSAAGALRNLSACGDPEVCDAMLEQDVMTPLVALFKQTQDGWTISKKKENKIDTKEEILVEATHLLWNLCESNSIALHVFNREELLPILLQFLNPTLHGEDLAIAVAQCVHTASEDNQDAIDMFGRPGLEEPVEALVQLEGDGSSTTLLRTLGAGILLNLHEGRLLSCPSSLVSIILKILTQTLSVDVTVAVTELAGMMDAKQSQARRRKNEDDESDTQDVAISDCKKQLDNLLSAAIYALEMLTNICCSDDGGDWDDVDSSDASDELFCPDADMDGEMPNEKFPLSIPSEIHEAILSHNIVTKVLNKIVPFTPASCTLLQASAKPGRSVLKRLCALQCRSLLCLHNLVSCLDVEDLGGSAQVHSVWLSLAQIAFKHTCVCPADSPNPLFCNTTEHVEFLEAVTRAMRGVLQKLAQVKAPLVEQLSPSDVQLMCEVAELCTDTSVRTNIINIIGTIGNMLSHCQDASAINTIKSMGVFLLELCSKETELTVTAEALDAIFDVFAEDHLDSIARDINLVERLKQVLPSLKSKINSQRKTLGEHYPIVVTAKTNLVRFIRYKNEMQSTNGHQQPAG